MFYFKLMKFSKDWYHYWVADERNYSGAFFDTYNTANINAFNILLTVFREAIIFYPDPLKETGVSKDFLTTNSSKNPGTLSLLRLFPWKVAFQAWSWHVTPKSLQKFRDRERSKDREKQIDVITKMIVFSKSCKFKAAILGCYSASFHKDRISLTGAR